jgi:crotonobetainyl-CoA:carnitine CoA-transferase CaiB-like acyl-CoA transferase
MQGLLEGIRILDMTIVVMGPYATQVLGDFGADVIKVESPSGDTTRKIGPMRNPGMGYVFLNLNRNKRSIAIDLKHPDGLAALFKLAESADVLVSNVRPKAMARLGLTYERLSEANPRLIVAGLVGCAQDGPYADQPVYEDLIQGLTAVPSMLVAAGAQQPIYVPMAFNDRMVGLYAASAILASLLHRERTGRGLEIEIPMFETMVQGTLLEHMGGLTFDPPNGPPGYRRSLNAERRPFPTADGHVCAVIYTDAHWHAFMDLIGQSERMETDPRLRDITARTEHAGEVYSLIGRAMRERTTAEWLEAFSKADIPAAPLHTLESLLDDPHLGKIGFFEPVEHPSEGRILGMAVPGRWSESQPRVRRLAPRLGEHSLEVLREAGVAESTLAELVASKAIGQDGVA